jgi:hypothetical protein
VFIKKRKERNMTIFEFELRVLLEPNYEGGEGLNYNSDYPNQIADFCACGLLKEDGTTGQGKKKRTLYRLTPLGQNIIDEVASKCALPRLALVSRGKEFNSFISAAKIK